MPEIIPEAISPNKNLPYIYDTKQVNENEINITDLVSFTYLSSTQRNVLVAMIRSMTSDHVRTDKEIAEIAECHEHTVQNCKHNVHFLNCLLQITKELSRYDTPEIVKSIKKKALEGSVRAQELYLRYNGAYVPRSQAEVATMSLNSKNRLNTGDAISEFVAALCDNGWNIQRILSSVEEAYLKLKEQNRVI